MLSKLVREDEDFPPKKEEKSGLGYAAEHKIQPKIWLKYNLCARYFFLLLFFSKLRGTQRQFLLKCIENTFNAVLGTLDL